jgi:hypothetical protein
MCMGYRGPGSMGVVVQSREMQLVDSVISFEKSICLLLMS